MGYLPFDSPPGINWGSNPKPRCVPCREIECTALREMDDTPTTEPRRPVPGGNIRQSRSLGIRVALLCQRKRRWGYGIAVVRGPRGAPGSPALELNQAQCVNPQGTVTGVASVRRTWRAATKNGPPQELGVPVTRHGQGKLCLPPTSPGGRPCRASCDGSQRFLTEVCVLTPWAECREKTKEAMLEAHPNVVAHSPWRCALPVGMTSC